MKSNKIVKRLAEPGVAVHVFFLVAFAAATLFFRMYYLAAAEGAVILLLQLYTFFVRRRKEKQLAAYIESIAYDTENAKNNTLMNFPLPIAVFRMDDSRIIWGNDMFFAMCGSSGARMDCRVVDLVPDFSGKWLMDGQTSYPGLLEIGGRKYQLHGNIIRSDREQERETFMGLSYWVDVTEYDRIRQEYEDSRPIPGVIVIDNLEELCKNQSDRVKNDIRDAVEDKLNQWCGEHKAILRRYDRAKYLLLVEKRNLDQMREEKFAILEQMHQVESPNGVGATISIGLGEGAGSFAEGLHFADMAAELALSRGGDQTVIKNRLNFEFFGGRGYEVEKRTKVRSRVMANTLVGLIKDSSRVLVMGHRFGDLDSVGAAVGVCCLARSCGVKAHIVMDVNQNAAHSLLDKLRREPEYKDAFITPHDGLMRADSRTLLVVVDTNRPEQVEDNNLLLSCNRVAVLDHHRVAATSIQNAALGFVEPYASSACELITEILQEVAEQSDVLRCEAEAMLAGIVLDTKSFTLRTGERTFDAAAYLRRCGADTTEVKKLFQMDLESTVAKYKVMQMAKIYRKVAVASPTTPQTRVTAAQAADEMLNISGVEATVVVAPDGKGGCFASARSIGELNVQLIMEKLGGGGNRSAAAAQFPDMELPDVVEKVYGAIDEYLG